MNLMILDAVDSKKIIVASNFMTIRIYTIFFTENTLYYSSSHATLTITLFDNYIRS